MDKKLGDCMIEFLKSVQAYKTIEVVQTLFLKITEQIPEEKPKSQ